MPDRQYFRTALTLGAAVGCFGLLANVQPAGASPANKPLKAIEQSPFAAGADEPAAPQPAIAPPTSVTRPTAPARPQFRGNASWYGPGFHGRRAASGEIFNQNALTAAHRTLPFGTRVKVTNLQNGRSTVVRITDRGPFVGDRVIDLSRAAAQQLNAIRAGVIPVQVEVLGR